MASICFAVQKFLRFRRYIVHSVMWLLRHISGPRHWNPVFSLSSQPLAEHLFYRTQARFPTRTTQITQRHNQHAVPIVAKNLNRDYSFHITVITYIYPAHDSFRYCPPELPHGGPITQSVMFDRGGTYIWASCMILTLLYDFSSFYFDVDPGWPQLPTVVMAYQIPQRSALYHGFSICFREYAPTRTDRGFRTFHTASKLAALTYNIERQHLI